MIEGKTCLITGSTSGIGKQIAIGLAKLNGNVVLVGRKKDRCEATVDEIKRNLSTNTKKDRISYLLADLSSQASIRELAEEFLSSHGSLDILVNNAGVFLHKRFTTVDGLEYTFAVNHLAPFLLTNLLFERIKASTPSRIITTSSVAHRGAQINFDDLQFEKRRYTGVKAYSQSKLANILFTKELSRRSTGSGVTSNCFHPGGVRTNLVQTAPWYYRFIWAIVTPFLISPWKGADTAIYLASSSEVEETSGKYFVKRRDVRISDPAEDHNSAVRLWKISEELTGIRNNRIDNKSNRVE
jgi:NAD(P)-dependent dehydrogenase (short-subunit alcohol dehydrogenase family)